MAVDTRDKRFSMMNLVMPWVGGGLPLADGSVDQPDRQQFLWGYPGITWTGVVAAAEKVRRVVGGIGRVVPFDKSQERTLGRK